MNVERICGNGDFYWLCIVNAVANILYVVVGGVVDICLVEYFVFVVDGLLIDIVILTRIVFILLLLLLFLRRI